MLQIFAVSIAACLVLSVRISGRESISAFDSLSRVSKNEWKYEIRHVSGVIPDSFLSYLSQSSMTNMLIARESIEIIQNQNLRILSIIVSDKNNQNILSDYPDATCLVKKGISFSCEKKQELETLPYDVIKIGASTQKPSFIALFDESIADSISLLPQYFPGLLIETKQDKFSRAENITFAYRSNLNFLILLSVFLTSFVVFSCALHGYTQTKKLIISFRTLGASSSMILFFSSLESLFTGIAGSIIGLTIFSPLTEFLARAYFISTQAHHQGSLNIPSFHPQYTSDIPIVLLVSIGASFAGTLLPTLSILHTNPSLSPKEDETHAVPLKRLTTISIALVILAPLIFLFSKYAYILPLSYISALLLFLTSGILSFLLLRPIARFFIVLSKKISPGVLFSIRSLEHEPFRFGLSAFSFGAALAFLISLNIFVDSFRATLESWMNTTFNGDLYVRDDSGMMPLSAIQSLEQSDSVSWIVQTKEIDTPYQDGRIKIYLVPFQTVIEHSLYDFLQPSSETGNLIVSEVAKAKFNINLGDTITLFGKNFFVKGFFRDFANERGAFLLDRQAYENANLPTVATKTISAAFLSPADALKAQETLKNLKIPSLVTFNSSTLKNEALKIFDDTFRITTYIKILIFLVCIINFTLIFLHDIEIRARHYGTLRLLGFSVNDFLLSILSMTLVILLSSSISGLFFGILLGNTIVSQINPLSFGWTIHTTVTALTLVIPLCFAAVSMFLALPVVYKPMMKRIIAARVSLE
jgi:putative ABC transport system permease protein